MLEMKGQMNMILLQKTGENIILRFLVSHFKMSFCQPGQFSKHICICVGYVYTVYVAQEAILTKDLTPE